MSEDEAGRLARSWESNAGGWTDAVREGRIESRRLATDAAIVEAVLARSPRRVLDVGCGEGWLCRALAGSGVEAVGIDASAPLVEAARAAGGAEYHLLPYAALSAPPERVGDFDAVVCNFALLDERLDPPLGALRPLLRPGGVLLVQTVHPWAAAGDGPYRDGWRTETFAGFGPGFAEPMPWYFRTLESWVGALRDAGWRVEEVREPLHPRTGRPASLLLTASPLPHRGPAGAPPGD